MVQFASLAQSPFGFEMSAKTTKSKLFGKLASIPKGTATFLIFYFGKAQLCKFSHIGCDVCLLQIESLLKRFFDIKSKSFTKLYTPS